MQSYISTSTAALLTGEDRRRVFEKIAGGVYETRKQRGDRGGGNGGESYQIAVSSLPVEAQIIYAQRGGVINGPINDDCDLAATTPASATTGCGSCWASSGPSWRAWRSGS